MGPSPRNLPTQPHAVPTQPLTGGFHLNQLHLLFPLKTIGHILACYTAWILGLMKLLGVWGVFMIAFADSALLGMPVDFIVATYVYQDRRRLLLYVAMASLGSALGSIPLYIVGYLGGEKVLRKRISEERFLKIHRSFERHEFWALMFPGVLPPPLPYKIFVLGAAVFEMRFRDFLVAIFLGRFIRFGVLSVLVLWFGPPIVGLFGGVVRRHWILILAAAIMGGVVWWLVRRQGKAGRTEGRD
jgi:membrane protein YqaA with SNARE-associated domain